MKNSLLLSLCVCSLLSCSESQVIEQNFDQENIGSMLISSYNDIFLLQDVVGGVENIEKYLYQTDFDTSYFEPFNALIIGYTYIGDFEKADSLLALINRDSLSQKQDLYWIEHSYNLAVVSEGYNLTLEPLGNSHRHPADITNSFIADYSNDLSKWHTHTQLQNWDSSHFYYTELIESLRDSSDLKDFTALGEQDLNILESYLSGNLAHPDSASAKSAVLDIEE
jgi:hypothetical protein